MQLSDAEYLQAADQEVKLRRWRDTSEAGKFKTFRCETLFPQPPGIIAWYHRNFEKESFLLWHPAHKHMSWEKKIPGIGAIHTGWEYINGQLGAYRMRNDSPDENPSDIQPENLEASAMVSIIDTDGDPLFWVLAESKEVKDGTMFITNFIFPEATPDEFVEAHRRHCIEEMKGLTERAIDFQIMHTFGYMPSYEDVIKSGVVVHPFQD